MGIVIRAKARHLIEFSVQVEGASEGAKWNLLGIYLHRSMLMLPAQEQKRPGGFEKCSNFWYCTIQLGKHCSLTTYHQEECVLP